MATRTANPFDWRNDANAILDAIQWHAARRGVRVDYATARGMARRYCAAHGYPRLTAAQASAVGLELFTTAAA